MHENTRRSLIILICTLLLGTLAFFGLYRWDERAGRDQPVKRDDHAMDDLRYFVMTALERPAAPFWATGVGRGGQKRGKGEGY